MKQFLSFRWNKATNNWNDASNKHEFNYDALGNLSQNIGYDWNISNNNWLLSRKIEYNFDTDGHLAELIFDWDTTSNNWIQKTKKKQYTYDKTFLFGDLIIPNYFFDLYDINTDCIYYNEYNILSYKLNVIDFFSFKDNNWISTSKDTFYYSNTNITNLPVVEENRTEIYPNPAFDFVNIKLTNDEYKAEIKLYNLSGQMIYEKKIKQNERLNLSNLNPGAYIYYLIENNKNSTGKLIKK
jgi:hypothetical protein